MIITEEKIKELANEAGFYVSGGFVMSPHNGHFTKEIRKLVELVSAHAITSMQTGQPVVIEEPDYHDQAMGCGLEDLGITDRYEAMAYGWNQAIERMFEQIPDEPLYTHPAPVTSMQGDGEPVLFAHVINGVVQEEENRTASVAWTKLEKYDTPLYLHDRVKGVSDESKKEFEEQIERTTFHKSGCNLMNVTVPNEAFNCTCGASKDKVYEVIHHLRSQISTNTDGWVSVPIEPTEEMLKAMNESKAIDDEGEFPAMMDLLDFSGENKCRAVLRAAYKAMIAISQPKGE